MPLEKYYFCFHNKLDGWHCYGAVCTESGAGCTKAESVQSRQNQGLFKRPE